MNRFKTDKIQVVLVVEVRFPYNLIDEEKPLQQCKATVYLYPFMEKKDD